MKQYFVYVIELDPAVMDRKKFRVKNQNYISGNDCVYVGQSSRKPFLRFEQHKEGYNPIPTRKDAEEIEEMLGKELRSRGYGVWFN
jgi:hypothetical protein